MVTHSDPISGGNRGTSEVKSLTDNVEVSPESMVASLEGRRDSLLSKSFFLDSTEEAETKRRLRQSMTWSGSEDRISSTDLSIAGQQSEEIEGAKREVRRWREDLTAAVPSERLHTTLTADRWPEEERTH